MQDRNKLEELMQTRLGTFSELQKEPIHPKAVQRTISELPNQGDIVKIRGLDFVVHYVNKRTGKLHLEICVVEQQGEAEREKEI